MFKNHRKLMVSGMFALAFANLWPRYVHASAGLTADLIDGIHGFLFGIAITLLFGSVYVRSARQR